MSRFTRQEIQALAVALDLPEEIVCTNRIKEGKFNALCISISYPQWIVKIRLISMTGRLLCNAEVCCVGNVTNRERIDGKLDA